MKRLLFALCLIPSVALAEDILNSWSAVTEDTVGNPIVVDEYNVYIGTEQGVLGEKVATVETNEYKFTENKPGTYYGSVTAVLGDLESKPSNEASFTIAPKPPAAPKTYKITIEGIATLTELP